MGELNVDSHHHFLAVLAEAQDQFIERFVRLGRDFDSGKALVRPFLPDLYFRDFEAGAAR